MKECYPVQTAEYAVAQQIAEQPAFNWWVKPVLKKRNRIISLVKKRKNRYARTTHQFGIKIPKNMAEAIIFDEENGNTYWQDAIAKEITNVKCAFQTLEDESVPLDTNLLSAISYFRLRSRTLGARQD